MSQQTHMLLCIDIIFTCAFALPLRDFTPVKFTAA